MDLKELRERSEPLRVQRQFTERELDLRSDLVRLPLPAQGVVTVSPQQERVQVCGSVEAQVTLSCCRCLGEFSQLIGKEFDLLYEPDPAVETEGEEIALSYGDLGIGFYRNDELDLAAIIGEQILLEIPMKPVCRENCLGLCSICGADLNEGRCDCSSDSSDPRLAALLELKKRMTE